MGRLTYSEGGRFGVVGMNEANVEEKLYGCVCKLKDYENTGLSRTRWNACWTRNRASPALRAQSITQIIPAHETVATFGRRDIDADGHHKKADSREDPGYLLGAGG